MADEQIVTSIVAKADLSSLVTEVHRVTASLQTLQRELLASNKSIAAATKVANNAFKDTLVQSGLFSSHFVNLHSDVDKFGRNLDSGRLKLKDYFSTFQQHAKTSKGLIRELAKEQVMLQNAILQPLGRNAQGLMQFNVAVPRGLDVVKNKTQLARMEMQIMNRALSEGATSLINWGKNTQWAGRQLTVGLTVPITMFGTQAAKAFREADQELTRLTKVYGGLAATSSADLSQIRKDVAATAKELSATMGVNFKETIALAADIAATGKQGNDLLGSLKETTRLAVLGEVDRQDAMKATLAIQSAFKQNTEQLADSINFLNAVENQTSTTLNDLVEAIPKAGPVIKGLGGNVQDLALYLTAMREGGISASEGANALKSALASLINPTDVAVAKFQSFGIDLLGIVNNNAGNVTNTLFALQSALDNLNPLQKQQAIEQLFGKFQFSRLNALFENLGKQGSQTLQVLDLMKASSQDLANIAGRELSMVTESASGKFKRAMESFKASLTGVGEQFLNFGTKILNVLEKVMNFFNNLPGPVKKFMALFGGLTAIAGPLIMITGVLANFFGYITKGIVLMRQFFMGQKGWKMLTPEMIAAQKAADMVEKSFYSDAQAAEVLHSALMKLITDYNSLNAAMSKGAVPVPANPGISTTNGSPIIIPGTPAAMSQLRREVDPNNPYAGEANTRAISHINPRDKNNPATFLGGVPGAIPVNQKIGKNPQIYMTERLPNIEGLTSIGGVSTGIVAGEAARYHALLATLGMQTEAEIAALKKTISLGGTIGADLLSTFDDILPITMRLSENAAKDAAAIVANLRAGNLTVDQARAEIIALNARLEASMQTEIAAFAGARGRTIDFTKAPLMQQPVTDANAQFTLRDLYKKENNRAVMEEFGRLRGVRTFGAPYSIHTTRLPKFNVGGPVRSSKGSYGNPAPVESFGPGKVTVSGDTSINYDDRLGSVPLGGYVLNQSASMDSANSPITDPSVVAATYSGTGGGNITAALTPGEIVYGPNIQRMPELYAAVDAANNGYNFGGQILARAKNYGREINDAELRDLYKKIFMVEDRVLKSPNWQEEVRLRHILHDAAILSSHAGLSEDQAIKKATDYFDEAWKKSYNPTTKLIDPKLWMRHRMGLGARISGELEALSGKINPETGKPYRGLFGYKGVGQSKGFRPTSSLIMKLAAMAESGQNGISKKVFDRAISLLYPTGTFDGDTFKAFDPSDKKKKLLPIEELTQGQSTRFLPVSEHAIREQLWRLQSIIDDPEYANEVAQLKKVYGVRTAAQLKKAITVGFAGNFGFAMMGEDAINSATAAIHKATGGARPDQIRFTNAAVESDIRQQTRRNVSFTSSSMNRLTKDWLVNAILGRLDSRSYFMPNAYRMAYPGRNKGGFIPGFNLGMPLSYSKFAAFMPLAEKISARVASSRLRNVKPIDYGHLVQPSGGRSFPIPNVGGVYRKPDGEFVFIKPMMDETAARAELRATSIARLAHGLDSPRQTMRVMKDPTDPTGKRKFIVLESPYNPKLASGGNKFTKKQMFRQNVAAFLRGDKDLSESNLYGNVLADVGTAGVFTRASGVRQLGARIPSMKEMATIDLLGVKGGAKKAYAQNTAKIASKLTPDEYHNQMIAEIQRVLPRLKKVVSTFKLTKVEKKAYEAMIARLEDGLNTNWRPFQQMHAAAGGYRRGGPISRGRKAYGATWPPPKTEYVPKTKSSGSTGTFIAEESSLPITSVFDDDYTETRSEKMQRRMMSRMNLGFGMQMAGGMMGGNLGTGLMLGGTALQISQMFKPGTMSGVMRTMTSLSAIMTKLKTVLPAIGRALLTFGKALRSAFTLTNPIGWIVTAVVAIGTYLSKLKKVREEQGKANRLEFGGTKESYASVGIKNYKSLTDRVKEYNQQLELNKAKVRSTFDSYTKTGVTGITLTIKELSEAIKNAKENQTDYVNAINTLQRSEVIPYVTNLKAQFVALGLSSSEAANNIYAILKASKYADQALAAVSSSGFRAIIDQTTALSQLVKNLSANVGGSFNAEEFNVGIDALVNGAMNYMQYLMNAKETSGSIKDEFDALVKTLEEVSKVQGSSNLLTAEKVEKLKEENLIYANILGVTETTESILAKMVLYQSGMASVVDLTQMAADEAIRFAKNLKTVDDKIDSIFENKDDKSNPLSTLASILDKAKNAANKSADAIKNAKKFDKDAIEEQIKNQRELIDAIDEERQARLKVLDVQEASANFENDIKSAQIKYQQALAAGDMAQAAQAQLDIERISGTRQRDLAKGAINDEADRRIKAAQDEIDRLQQIIDDQAKQLDLANQNNEKNQSAQQTIQTYMNTITDIVRNYIDPETGKASTLSDDDRKVIMNLIQEMKTSKDVSVQKAASELEAKYVIPRGTGSDANREPSFQAQKFIDDLAKFALDKGASDANFMSAVTKFAAAVDKFSGWPGGPGQALRAPEKGEFVDTKWWNPTSWGPRGSKDTTWMLFEDKDGKKWAIPVDSGNWEDVGRKAIARQWAFRGYSNEGISTKTATQNTPPKGYRKGDIDQKADGGRIRHYEPGGAVSGPGTETSDSIPAMLSDGEYVIRAAAAKEIGYNTLDAWNALGRANGGPVFKNGAMYAATGTSVVTPDKPSTKWTLKEKQDYLMSFLMNKGFTYKSALGVVANLMWESGGGLQPHKFGDYDPDGRYKQKGSFTSYGIAQWHNTSKGSGRWQNLLNFAKSNKMNAATLEAQAQFLWHELQQRQYADLVTLLRHPSTDALRASQLWMTIFERPKDQSLAMAQKRLNMMNGYKGFDANNVSQPTSSTTSNQTSNTGLKSPTIENPFKPMSTPEINPLLNVYKIAGISRRNALGLARGGKVARFHKGGFAHNHPHQAGTPYEYSTDFQGTTEEKNYPKSMITDYEGYWREMNKKTVKIKVPPIRANFKTNSFELSKEQQQELTNIANELIKYKIQSIVVQGHADSRGGVDNDLLSLNRAKATADFLKNIVPNVNFIPVGYGIHNPLVPNTSSANMAQNRRAELFLPDQYETVYPELDKKKFVGILTGGGSINGGGTLSGGTLIGGGTMSSTIDFGKLFKHLANVSTPGLIAKMFGWKGFHKGGPVGHKHDAKDTWYDPKIDKPISKFSSLAAKAFANSPFGYSLPAAHLGVDLLGTWLMGRTPTFGKNGIKKDLDPKTYIPLLTAFNQAMMNPLAEIAKGSGTKGDWLNSIAMLPLPTKIGQIPSLVKGAQTASKVDNLIPSLGAFKSIYKTEKVTAGANEYSVFSLGNDKTKFAFQGFEGDRGNLRISDMSELLKADSSINIVPTTPQGLIEAALKLKPKDKNLLALLDNFKNKKYGDSENEILDFMNAAVSIDSKGKAAQSLNTNNLAMVISHLTGNQKASSLLQNKKSILDKLIKQEQKGVSIGTPYEGIEAISAKEIPLIHSTKFDIVRDAQGNILVHPSGYHRVGEGQLPPGSGDIFTSGAPRSTVHTTAFGVVESHMQGQWGSDYKKIVSTLDDVMKANNRKPYDMNPIDTYFSLNPGEALKFPKNKTVLIDPFNNELKYSEELIKRGLIKKGEDVPMMVKDPKTNEVLHLSKGKYSQSELEKILELVHKYKGSRYEISGQDIMYKERSYSQEYLVKLDEVNDLIDQIAVKYANEMLGIEAPIVKVSGHALSSEYLSKQIYNLANEMGVPVAQHNSNKLNRLETLQYLGDKYLAGPNSGSYTDPITNEALRFQGLRGFYKTPSKPISKSTTKQKGDSWDDEDFVNYANGGLVKGFANGGLVSSSKFGDLFRMLASGGYVNKFAQGGHAIKDQSLDARYNASGVAKQTGMIKHAKNGPVYNIGNMPFNFPQTPQNGRQMYDEFKALLNFEMSKSQSSVNLGLGA